MFWGDSYLDKLCGGNTNINDGFYELTFKNEGIFIKVYPPANNGRKVQVKDVIDKLNSKQVKEFNKDIIEYAVLKADKTPVKIAEPQEEIKIDASLSVFISPDKMKCFVLLTPPDGGRMLDAEHILGELSKNGVTYGINNALIDSIAKSPVYNQMICVAEGTEPVYGQNGAIEFYFDINRDKKPTILDDGRVDFRDLDLIENVSRGQALCALIPPVPGIKGKRVTGEEIPTVDGKPAVLPKGKNVNISEDGQSIVAAIDGQVQYTDDKVNVFATYEVPADVDNSTGNISFIGNIFIRGNVLSGFEVEAGGNVEVWGVVEGAVIKAGGDIILRRGIQGLGKGTLISGNDVFSRYIENSIVEAKNNVTAEAIMHSNIKCGNKLELVGKKGLLVGGTSKVAKEINAKVIGSHMAVSTIVEVGLDPKLRERYKQLKEELSAMETDLLKAEQAITLLKKLEYAGMLNQEKRELLVKSVRTKVYYSSRINDYKEELKQIDSQLQQEAFGKVHCYKYIYPGVRVSIGSAVLHLKEALHYCTLYRCGEDIRVGPIA
jgi:uncharacterized protein (DUF342 family)